MFILFNRYFVKLKISNKNQRKIVPNVKELVSEIVDFLETEKLLKLSVFL